MARASLRAPQAGVVAASALDGALRGVGLQHLQHDAAIRAQDLAAHLHVDRQLLVAAAATHPGIRHSATDKPLSDPRVYCGFIAATNSSTLSLVSQDLAATGMHSAAQRSGGAPVLEEHVIMAQTLRSGPPHGDHLLVALVLVIGGDHDLVARGELQWRVRVLQEPGPDLRPLWQTQTLSEG